MRSRQDGINKLRQRVISLGEALALIRQLTTLRKTQLERLLDEARGGGWARELENDLTTFRELYLDRQAYGETESTLEVKIRGFEARLLAHIELLKNRYALLNIGIGIVLSLCFLCAGMLHVVNSYPSLVKLEGFVWVLAMAIPFTPAEVGQVQPESAAEQGGVQPGDVILSIDGSRVQRFEDVRQIVRLNPSVPMTIVVRRDGQEQTLHITPSRTELTDRFGNRYQIGLLSIARPSALRKS